MNYNVESYAAAAAASKDCEESETVMKSERR